MSIIKNSVKTMIHVFCLYLDEDVVHKQKSYKISYPTSQIEVLNKHLLITSKPMIYLVNLSEKDYVRKKNKW